MSKLIGIILAAAPIVLFLRAIFRGQLQKRSQGLSDFRKQMDFLVWAIIALYRMWSCLRDRKVNLSIFDLTENGICEHVHINEGGLCADKTSKRHPNCRSAHSSADTVDHFLRRRSLRLIRQVTRPRRIRSSTGTSSISRRRTRRQFSNLTLMGPDQRSTPFRLTRQPKENIIPGDPRRAEWWSTSPWPASVRQDLQLAQASRRIVSGGAP
jgi:hypothetical protein